MAPIIAPRGIMPPMGNNPEIRPNAAKTETGRERKTITIPGKGGIPAGGATVAADVRITEAPGRTGTTRKKAISSE